MSPSAIVEANDMAAQSTFSYAQAAKGKGTITASNNAASADAVAPIQDDQAPAADTDTAAPVGDAQTDAPLAEQVTSEAPETVGPQTAVTEKHDTESVPGSESDARSESTQSRRTESRREDDTGRLDRPWRRNDKTPRSSSNATRSVDEQDSRKARRGKKGKASEKQAGEQATDKEQETAPEQPKVELAEAPIPSVNIWHKRKEARQAKSTKPSPTPAEATTNGTSSQKDEKKMESSPAPLTNGVKSHQRQASTVRAERNGPRGSRMNEKDGKSEVPPSVDDSTAWPTPETAISTIKEDSKKKATDKTPERSDRSDKDSQEDSSSSKARRWVSINYVPTVNFETQLPQIRNSKPRGGARGSRDATNRASINGVAEKLTSASLANRASDNKARDASNNAASQPSTKRGSVDIANGQKKASTNANFDKAKDPSAQTSEAPQASRDRPEGRGERGRGGYRGRAHHGHSQSQHAISGSGYHGQGANASRTQGYSPPMRQGGHGGSFTPSSQRGRGRNGANNFHRMSAPSGGNRMPVVQPQFAPVEYSMGVPMDAALLQNQFGHFLLPALKHQVEYYFSIDNLIRDTFLRRHMDSHGFVSLHFVLSFRRLQEMTEDINLVRAACEDSTEIDYAVADDGIELLRRRDGWQAFVLPIGDRDEMARREGPPQVTFKNRHYNFTNGQYNAAVHMPYGTPMYHHDPSPQHFQPRDVNGDTPVGASQLSAAVPDFSPSGTIPLVGPDGQTQVTSVEALTNGYAENATPLANGVHAEASQVTES
jgi:la-related protein 1